MAHQDLKPSNVLVYQNDGGAKVGDLGRAWSRELPSPHDNNLYAGDPGYTPPELYLGITNPDQRMRRMGYDMYQLGSLIVFVFTYTHMNSVILKQVQGVLGAGPAPAGPFDLLPYFQAAFSEALLEFTAHLPIVLREDLKRMVSQLCEPDPYRRGHPTSPHGSYLQYSLDRYISWLNLLAYKAEVRLLRGSR